MTRQLFTFLQDRENLIKHKIADTKFEPEGIRVKNGRMYLGAGVHRNNEALETVLILPNKVRHSPARDSTCFSTSELRK